MKSKVIININETVYFKPTLAGKLRYNRSGCSGPLEVDEDGYAKMTFWVFLRIFGDMYKPGSRTIPTVFNDIEFRDNVH